MLDLPRRSATNTSEGLSEFDTLVRQRCEALITTLSVKGREYRRNNNEFHNFEKGGQITGQSREKVLIGFMLKHLISVMDIVDDLDKGIEPSPSAVDEKVGDLIVYLTILEAMLKQKK